MKNSKDWQNQPPGKFWPNSPDTNFSHWPHTFVTQPGEIALNIHASSIDWKVNTNTKDNLFPN